MSNEIRQKPPGIGVGNMKFRTAGSFGLGLSGARVAVCMAKLGGYLTIKLAPQEGGVRITPCCVAFQITIGQLKAGNAKDCCGNTGNQQGSISAA